MAISPMMQQYIDIKESNPDSIIFFRLGDFYEMFFEQAELCSRELDLTLTGKDCGLEERAPMCGIPYHAVDAYVAKLVNKGYKVAICEQTEDPKLAKGLVKRDITQIVTPGTITKSEILDENTNNRIANIYLLGSSCALTCADISTGECNVTSVSGVFAVDKIVDEIIKLTPKEIVLNDGALSNKAVIERLTKKTNIYISRYNDESEEKREWLESLGKFSLVEEKSILLMTNYIFNTQKGNAQQMQSVTKYELERYMCLDANTRNNLEITQTLRDKTKKGSLLWVLDKTVTPMGARKLRQIIESPHIKTEDIEYRLDAVDALCQQQINRENLIQSLRNVRDTQRIMSKIANSSNNARDFLGLKESLKVLPSVKEGLKAVIDSIPSKMLVDIYNNLDELVDICDLLEKSIEEQPPITITEGGVIKKGYNQEIDELRLAKTEGQGWVMQLEATEKEATGIKGLKVGYNRVFGYYIEISRLNVKDIPEGRYIRKQTLVDKERYITEELKNIEEKILGSEEKTIALEYNLFCEIRRCVAKEIIRVQRTSEAIALLDTLCSMAKVAEENDYVRPQIDENRRIHIVAGRHPVVEKTIQAEQFIPNDTDMDQSNEFFHVITGPNMAGKSTYMRQIALICYMAQIGSFVPAKEARLGVVDRIFTRVGASDDLANGESTFMVEMAELANILTNATSNSLVILDEIGRGTSTYDGMAIAWSTIEHIAKNDELKCKTLFATHYHELEVLEGQIAGVKNYSVAVKEKGDDVIFLRKIVPQPADSSYGIYVAKLAGVPHAVVNRAKELLKNLEKEDIKKKAEKNETKVLSTTMQVDMLNYRLAEVGKIIEKISLDELTAKEALDVLYKLKEKMK